MVLKARAVPHATPIDIGVFKSIENNSTTTKHIYNESANILEGCNVAFGASDWPESPINGASDWQWAYDDMRLPSLQHLRLLDT